MTGILLALVGIGILVLWRSGALKNALGISAPASRNAPSVIQQITRTGAPTVATSLPTASLVPIGLSPQAPGNAVAVAGQPDNGYGSTYIGSPSWVAWVREEQSLGKSAAQAVAVVRGGGSGSIALSPV
jgi:hypothetical protein